MSDLSFASAGEIARRIRARAVSSRAVTEHFIDRIERLDGALNAVVVRDFARARDAADAADAALAHGEAVGALHGVPLTVKESYNIVGLPTTWGIPAFRDNIATTDAAVVASLRAAGAILLGKTNVPVELADFQSFNPIYGTTNNPWNPARVPGGSSGGSAVALAAGFTPLEFGSDIGGSIRNPAHFCGVYGHKPTWNIVPAQGHALPGMLAFFGEWDILICPQMPTTAFPHDQSMPMTARTIRIDNADHPYFQQIYWAGLTTVAYLPSTVFPTGPSREGLPIGLQAVAAEFADHTCIDFARLLARETGGFVPPPAFSA